MRRLVVLFLLLLVLPLDGAKRRAVGKPGGDERLLFVGNSLTYFNDLPGTVCRLARHQGKALTCTAVAFPDFSLLDHLGQGDAQAQIESRRYTTVVLQQGPSALESSRRELLDTAGTFNSMIRAAGGRPAFYAVWPQSSRQFDFARSAESYRLAAATTNALLFPVGETWQKAWALDASIPLYSADGLHPTRAGSYLAALVIYRVLYGELPEAFGDRDVAGDLGVSEAQLRSMWTAAR